MSAGVTLNQREENFSTQLWKKSDFRANKSGQLKGVFFVSKSKPDEEGIVKGGDYFVKNK